MATSLTSTNGKWQLDLSSHREYGPSQYPAPNAVGGFLATAIRGTEKQ